MAVFAADMCQSVQIKLAYVFDEGIVCSAVTYLTVVYPAGTVMPLALRSQLEFYCIFVGEMFVLYCIVVW